MKKLICINTLILFFSFNLFASQNFQSKINSTLQTNPPKWVSSVIVKANAFANGNYNEDLNLDVKNAEGSALVFTKINGPIWLTVNADGKLLGKPNDTNLGENNFEIEFKNQNNLIAKTNLIITVIESNHKRTLDELNSFEIGLNNTANGKINPMPSDLKNMLLNVMLAEDDINIGNFEKARERIDPLLINYPLLQNQNVKWNNFNSWITKVYPKFIFNTPVGYTNLRIIDEFLKLKNNNPKNPTKSLTFSIILVNKVAYPKPDGSGDEIVDIDSKVIENEYQFIRDHFNLFSKYIYVLTNGEAELKIQYIKAKDDYIHKYLYTPDGKILYSNGINLLNLQPIDKNLADASDIFMGVFPIAKPKDPIFNGIEIRLPGFSGSSNGKIYPRYTQYGSWEYPTEYPYISSKLSGPDGNTHEYFHHIFKIFKEFELEKKSHQWFNRSKWPSDFIGSYEGDYYIESFTKRIKDATPNTYSRLNQSLVENEPPQWVSTKINLDECIFSLSYISNISSFATDKDNNQLIYKKVSGPDWLSISKSGEVSGIPNNTTNIGLNSFEVSIDDSFSVPIKTSFNIYTPTPLPYALPTQEFCKEANLENLSIQTLNGAIIKWYDSITSSTNLPINTLLENGRTYFFSQTINGFESKKTSVSVNNNSDSIPTILKDDKNNLIASQAPIGGKYQWYINSVLIAGAIKKEYQPTSDGIYRVKTISATGCESQFSNNIDINLNRIIAYPNPTKGELNISINNNNKVDIKVYESSGKLTDKYFGIKGSTFKIILKNFGLNIIEINTKDGKLLKTFKVLKN